MNKELIKKYKKEFDWWLNGGSILSYNTLLYKAWTECNSKSVWQTTNQSACIVINDEYVEFRKALAEGKIVECNIIPSQSAQEYYVYGDNQWYSTTDFTLGSPDKYRIKPDEPKVKIGDWVRYDNGILYQVKDVFEMDGIWYATSIKLNDRSEWNDNIHGEPEKASSCDLWEPKAGEWVVYNVSHNCFAVGKYHGKDGNQHIISGVFLYNYVQNCEPFIGKLPPKTKGNK